MPDSGGIRRLCTILRRAPALAVNGQQQYCHLIETARRAPVYYVQCSWPRSFFASPFGKSVSSVCVMPTAQKSPPPFWLCAHFSAEANNENAIPLVVTESAQELYDRLLKSVEAKETPPNTLLWSLVENCTNKEDIKLLFQFLQRLRVFRLSSLRIHSNYNFHLCSKITAACVRSDALEYGMMALWKHNVYGLSPTISSIHRLLLHAKEHNDVVLVEKIMDTLKRNSLPLQPGTADIVFSICYNANNWKLMLKYAKRFFKAGVKLHRSSYDNLMEFAAKMGDTDYIWKCEKYRSTHLKSHTLGTGFACAKAYLIKRKPDSAAAIISLLYQELPDVMKANVVGEAQKLVSEWPSELLNCVKRKDNQELVKSLRSDIRVMVASLPSMGILMPL